MRSKFPAIAQLVERLTVEVSQLSGGPWFESVLPDYFFDITVKLIKEYSNDIDGINSY